MQVILSDKARQIFNADKVRFYAKLRKRLGGSVLTMRPLSSNTKTEDQANVIDGVITIPDSFINKNYLEFKHPFYIVKATSSGQYSLIGVNEPSEDDVIVQIYL